MDREFMKSFCKNYYSDFENEAIKDSELYRERRAKRHRVENELTLRLQEMKDIDLKIEGELRESLNIMRTLILFLNLCRKYH